MVSGMYVGRNPRKAGLGPQGGAEQQGQATKEQLKAILGTAASKRGIFEGDVENGELEIGQSAAYIHSVVSAKEVLSGIISECESRRREMCATASSTPC